MYQLGLRRRLPKYITEFMMEKKLKVAVNWAESTEKNQEEGVPQESILSVTLFAIKINLLSSIIPSNIQASLFVDDLQIAYKDFSISQINKNLQTAINNIDGCNKWV